jgi:hypothetical protein
MGLRAANLCRVNARNSLYISHGLALAQASDQPDSIDGPVSVEQARETHELIELATDAWEYE